MGITVSGIDHSIIKIMDVGPFAALKAIDGRLPVTDMV
jgi:hypothetical protein